MAELVSKRYGNALYSLAVESHSVESCAEEAKVLLNLYATDKDFSTIMNHPHVSSKEKFNIIKNTFGNNLSDTIYGLFDVVFKKNRYTEIVGILEYFLEKVDEHLGRTEAIVISAVPLSEERIQAIKLKLTKKINKEISIVTKVDESIIGGLIIKVDSFIFNGSISNEIADINKQLHTI